MDKKTTEKKSVYQEVFTEAGTTTGYNALLLALTRNIKDETHLKEVYKEQGVQFVVTEIGGKSDVNFQDKINRAVIGASLNEGLVNKKQHDIHAVLHAAEEAKRGILVNTTSSTNIAIKIAIVRDEEWIAVAMFGESSIHPITSHERCGLGVMHI